MGKIGVSRLLMPGTYQISSSLPSLASRHHRILHRMAKSCDSSVTATFFLRFFQWTFHAAHPLRLAHRRGNVFSGCSETTVSWFVSDQPAFSLFFAQAKSDSASGSLFFRMVEGDTIDLFRAFVSVVLILGFFRHTVYSFLPNWERVSLFFSLLLTYDFGYFSMVIAP